MPSLLDSVKRIDGLNVIDLEKEISLDDIIMDLFYKETIPIAKDSLASVTKNEGQRYFGAQAVCRRCGEEGHVSSGCSVTPAGRCVYCTGYHPPSQCQYILCYGCGNCGHSSKNCREKKLPKYVCKHCPGQLHYATDCPKAWRKYNIANLSVKPNFKMCCGYCHSNDHFIDDCKMKASKVSIFTRNYKELVIKKAKENK